MTADKEVLPGLTLEQLAEALCDAYYSETGMYASLEGKHRRSWRQTAEEFLPTLEACVLRERLAEHDEMPCTIKNYGRSDKWAHLCGCQCGCGFRCPHRITLESQLAAKEAK